MDTGKIENLGIDRILKRGSGEIIAQWENALFIRDSISGVYFLAGEDTAAGLSLMDSAAGRDCDQLVVTGYALGMAVYERYGFTGRTECYQVAYYGEKPPAGGIPNGRSGENGWVIRTAEKSDCPVLEENYRLISPEEMEQAVERKNVWMGYDNGRPVGFIGEHLEGSMGMLYVFPEARRKGYGMALQSHLIAKTMERGDIPYGQVVTDNKNSLALQERLGMKRSEDLVLWMWK